MSYVLTDYRESTLPLVAIFRFGHPDSYTYKAEPIIGIGVYRDMQARGSENLVVPVLAEDLTRRQAHVYSYRADVEEGHLPDFVAQDNSLYEAVLARGGMVHVQMNDAGLWVIANV